MSVSQFCKSHGLTENPVTILTMSLLFWQSCLPQFTNLTLTFLLIIPLTLTDLSFLVHIWLFRHVQHLSKNPEQLELCACAASRLLEEQDTMSLQNQWKVPCVLFKCSHLCFFFGEVAISHPQSSRAAPHFVSHSFCRRAPSPLSLCSCSVSLCTVHCALCTLQSWGTNHCSHICVCYKEHLVPILVSFIAMHCGSPVLHFTVLFHSAVKCPPLKSNSHGWRLLRLCLGPASLPLCLPLLCQWHPVKCPPPSVKTNSHDWRLLHFKSAFTFLPTPLTPLSLRTNKLFHLLHTSSNGKSTKTFNALCFSIKGHIAPYCSLFDAAIKKETSAISMLSPKTSFKQSKKNGL